jgi:hypothetical protein
MDNEKTVAVLLANLEARAWRALSSGDDVTAECAARDLQAARIKYADYVGE